MGPQSALSIGVLESVIRVLEGLVPEEAGLPPQQARLVLPPPVVLAISSVALCTRDETRQKTSNKR